MTTIYPVYMKRTALMLFVAMPLVALGLAAVELTDASARAEGIFSVIGGAFVVVYFWGMLTGVVVSLAHTALVRLTRSGLLGSLGLGALLGAAGGALTPTFFTGVMDPSTILAGGVVGIVFGLLGSVFSGSSG
jgi:hypothetical protein